MLPEVLNTSGVKVPCSTSRILFIGPFLLLFVFVAGFKGQLSIRLRVGVEHLNVKQVIRVKKTRGAATPCTRITCTSFLGLEKPSLKLLRSSELQRTNSSPISNCRRSKSAIFISRNIKYNINSLLPLRVGIRIIYIYQSSVTYRKSK